MNTSKKIIGILGGMGPQASNELYRLLIEGAKQSYGARNNDEYPEILIDSVPVPDFLSDTKQIEPAAHVLEDRVRRQSTYGVSVIVTACNTAHILFPRLQNQTTVPMVSIIDEVVNKLKIQDKTILLLASPMTLRTGLYQNAMQQAGIKFMIPKEEDFFVLELVIRGVLAGSEKNELTHMLTDLADHYVDKNNIGGIVLGCTELPLVFPSNYQLPVYSSLSILADALLKRYYTKEDV